MKLIRFYPTVSFQDSSSKRWLDVVTIVFTNNAHAFIQSDEVQSDTTNNCSVTVKYYRNADYNY